MLDCSIIIVSWNVSALLESCIESILAGNLAINEPDSVTTSAEIIIIDSNSDDDTIAMLQEKFPQVRLLPQSENIGYTRGNNLGLEKASGRYLFLLNPDTLMIHDVIADMIAYMDAHPDVGIIGPHTLNGDGTHQYTRRRFPTLLTGFFESTWLESLAPRDLLNRYYIHDQPDDAVFDVDWVQGSALLARREVYEQIGGLDTGFIMFSEELDWCKRAKEVGWRVVYYGEGKIIHYSGKSTEQANAQKHIYFQQSKIRYFHKHHGAIPALILRLFLMTLYATQLVIEFVKGLAGHKRELRRERVEIYWQVLRSGLKASE